MKKSGPLGGKLESTGGKKNKKEEDMDAVQLDGVRGEER